MLVRAKNVPCHFCVRWIAEVGMRAIALIARDPQHLWSECGDDALSLHVAAGAGVGGLIHLLEIRSHGRGGGPVVQSPHAFDQRLMGNAKAQQKAIVGLFGDGLLCGQRHARFAVVDVDDARRDIQLCGVRQQPGGMGEGIATERFGKP